MANENGSERAASAAWTNRPAESRPPRQPRGDAPPTGSAAIRQDPDGRRRRPPPGPCDSGPGQWHRHDSCGQVLDKYDRRPNEGGGSPRERAGSGHLRRKVVTAMTKVTAVPAGRRQETRCPVTIADPKAEAARGKRLQWRRALQSARRCAGSVRPGRAPDRLMRGDAPWARCRSSVLCGKTLHQAGPLPRTQALDTAALGDAEVLHQLARTDFADPGK